MSGRCLDDPDEGYRLKCAGPEVKLFFQMLLKLQPSQRFDLLHAPQKHCQLCQKPQSSESGALTKLVSKTLNGNYSCILRTILFPGGATSLACSSAKAH